MNEIMLQIEDIEKAVKNLTDVELQRFRQWFASFDAEAWDAQIETDVSVGELDLVVNAAIADYQNGNAKEL